MFIQSFYSILPIKIRPVSLTILVLAGGVGFFFWKRQGPDKETHTASEISSETTVEASPVLETRFPGDFLLAQYGTSETNAVDDVHALGRVLDNFFLIHKNIDSFVASTNIDFTRLLQGENPDGEPFVSHDSPVFGENSRLIDRWGHPLFFHPLAKGKVEIRSAGPDKTLFTQDDIHRTPDGIILTAKDANTGSLFPPPGNR